MQKDSRLKRLKNTDGESAEEYIQFKLFRIKDHVSVDATKSSGLKLYANQLDRVGASGSYINSREVTKRFRVNPGYYLIVPSTYVIYLLKLFLMNLKNKFLNCRMKTAHASSWLEFLPNSKSRQVLWIIIKRIW